MKHAFNPIKSSQQSGNFSVEENEYRFFDREFHAWYSAVYFAYPKSEINEWMYDSLRKVQQFSNSFIYTEPSFSSQYYHRNEEIRLKFAIAFYSLEPYTKDPSHLRIEIYFMELKTANVDYKLGNSL